MKRLLFFLCAVLMFSCEKISTDSYESSILGKWQFVRGEWYDDGETQIRDYRTDEDYKYKLQFWSFSEDGKLIIEKWDHSDYGTEEYNYHVANNVLFTDYTESILTIDKLTKNEMVLIITYSYSSSGTVDGKAFFSKKK